MKAGIRWRLFILPLLSLCVLPAVSPAREAVVQFNTRGVAPNIDVLWQVSVTGDFVSLATQETGLVLTASSGNFAVQKAVLNPIGGGDRPSIVVANEPPFWTSRFDGFGVVYEISIRQAVTRNGQPATVLIPIAVRLIEERIEEKSIVAEFRNLRVQGTPDSQNLDYTFDIALMGTYCPNDVSFFVRSDSTRSASGSMNTAGEFKPERESLPAGTTKVIKDVRVSLFGPKREDREGIFRMALIGRDSKGNLVTTQCEVPLRPSWSTPSGAAAPPPAAP